jgi:hypothetical protein
MCQGCNSQLLDTAITMDCVCPTNNILGAFQNAMHKIISVSLTDSCESGSDVHGLVQLSATLPDSYKLTNHV